MEKFINPGILPDNADAVNEEHYSLPLTDDELVDRKDKLSQASIEETKIEEEKKEVAEEFKARLDPVKKQKNELIKEIRSGVKEVHGKVYTIFEHSEKKAYIYSQEGHLLKSRPLKDNETQYKLKMASNDGK